MEHIKKITIQTNSENVQEVLLRKATPGDYHLLCRFYENIPPAERYLFDEDILDPDVVKKRLSAAESKESFIILATIADRIIGECNLHRKLKSRSAHIGELQFYVLPEFRSHGIGITLLKEATHLALTEGIEKIYGYIPSKVISSFERLIAKLGFKQEAILANYIKDSSGRKQDLFVFGKDLEELWDKIADWQSPYGRAMEF